MTLRILKSYSEVQPFLERVQRAGDENRRALGFLARSAYEQQADRGRLWVAVGPDAENYVGHLLFGGRYPNLKIFQMYIEPSFRGKGVATFLLEELVQYGEKHSYLSISARVAEDLEANKFWEHAGLVVVKKERGGITTKRIINVRSRELDTPSLLRLMKSDAIMRRDAVKFVDRPTFSTPLYVLDVNVILDVTKKRVHRKDGASILKLGFANKIRLCVSAEFITELVRTTSDISNDPLLEFVKELPVLSASESIPDTLIKDLRVAVFPERSLTGRRSLQDNSDLMHLGHAISTGADGFITREKAILQASPYIFEKYGLDILSPTDVVLSEPQQKFTSIRIDSNHSLLEINDAVSADLDVIKSFLSNLGLADTDQKRLVSFRVSGSDVRRLSIKTNGKLIGYAQWDMPSSLSPLCDFHLYINESNPASGRSIDHVMECLFRSGLPQNIRRIRLHYAHGSEMVKAAAIARGFRCIGDGHDVLTKISWVGIITTINLAKFSYDFEKISGLKVSELNNALEGNSDTVDLTDTATNTKWVMPLFEFETLISPGIVMYKGREGLLVPIRPTYAADLEIIVPAQMSLLPKKEASLHVEKAYFRKPIGHNKFKKGMIVVFYISKDSADSKVAAGCGRITFSALLPVEDAIGRLYRQGVLNKSELLAMTNKSGVVHAYTYDNYTYFPKRVGRNMLKKTKAISGANLVTAELISSEKLSEILDKAFI